MSELHYCLTCGGVLPNHLPVHVRHGNGGGHNESCPKGAKEAR